MPDVTVDIPNAANWPLARMEQVCTTVARGRAPTYVEHSNVLAIGQRCVTHAGFDPEAARPHSERQLDGMLVAEPGDVLLNSTGTGTIGRSCVFDSADRFIVDGHVTLLRRRLDRADGRWLNAMLRTPWGQTFLETQCYSGSTNQVELSRTRLALARMPVPPLPEQRQIAAIFDTLDEAIRKTEAIIAKLKQVKQGLLHDLLTRGIDDNGELRDPERHPEQFKDSPLGRIPREWEVRRVGSLLSGIEQGWSPDCSSQPAEPGEWGVLRTTAVVWTGYQDHENKVLPSGLLPRPEYEVRPNDVLVTRAGPNSRVGVVALVEATQGRLMLSDKLYRLRPSKEVEPGYLVLGLSGQATQRHLSTLKTGLAESQTNISQHIVRTLWFSVPPQEEQETIVRAYDGLVRHLRSEDAQSEKLKLLKHGLMEDLLTGRVRVTDLLNEAAE